MEHPSYNPSYNNNNDDEDDDEKKGGKKGGKKKEYSCHQSYECESNNRHAAKSLYYPSLVVA